MPAERQSSAAVDLARPSLSTEPGGAFVVTGYLSRKRGAATTGNSHVDVQFLDATGTVLLEKSVQFTPQNLSGGSVRSRPHAKYQLTVGALPAGTARLRIVAHDRPHVENKT